MLRRERDTCPCCHGALVEIGADVAERLDVIPARFRVLVTRRPKLACRACPGVVLQAAAPERLVPGGLPTEASVAQMLVARYADHLPLYRQSQMMARQGVTIGREELADWIGTAAHEIVPVVRRMREILLASPLLLADETTMPVLDPGRGQVKKGFAWAIAREDRPRGGCGPPAVVFRYAPGRDKEHAAALLAGYRGILQCDGYAAYKALATGDGATLAFLPRNAQGTRGERSRPLVEALFKWLEAQLARLPARSPTAEAIRYALNHRDGLVRFLDNGRIEADTNTVERAIRPICLSRKNALFASGDDGGARWAAVASLVETCKMNGVDPQRYFTDLMSRLVNGWPISRIDELMPWSWAKTEPAPSTGNP